MTTANRVSVAIPLHNEQAVIPELIQRTFSVLDRIPGGPHEIVAVDDGSEDETLSLLAAAAESDNRIKVVSFSRNFGQQAAYSAALQYASGDAVVLMDGDLQDPPEAIPGMLQAFDRGYEVVYAVRSVRKENLVKRMCYSSFYRLIELLAAYPLPRDSGDFSIISRRVVEIINRSADRHRYLRGVRSWVGFRQIGVPVERDARAAGAPKYTLRGLLRLALNGIFSFSLVPLRLAIFMGLVSVLFAVILGAFSVYARLFTDSSPRGFTAIIVAVSFFSGIQLLFLGIVGEYVGRVFEEVKHRPAFIVEQLIPGGNQWIENTQGITENSTNTTGGGEVESI